MPITHSSDQPSKTLEQFYLEVSQQESYSSKSTGKLMLDLLKMINNTFQDTQLWGLTSHHRLVIQRDLLGIALVYHYQLRRKRVSSRVFDARG